MPSISSLKGLLATCAILLAAPCWSMATSPNQLVEDTAGRILSQIDANHSAYEAEPELLSEVVRTDLLRGEQRTNPLLHRGHDSAPRRPLFHGPDAISQP
jgi:hypothetical protein